MVMNSIGKLVLIVNAQTVAFEYSGGMQIWIELTEMKLLNFKVDVLRKSLDLD